METKELQNYRPKDAAKYLGVGLSTIWLYSKQKKLTAYNISPKVTIFRKEDLDAFVESSIEVD